MAEDETVGEPEPVPAETVETPEETTAEALPLAADQRPTRNVLAEIQRRDREGQARLTKIERQQQEILDAFRGMVQARAQMPVATPAPAAGSEYTDEQLGQLAAAGNAEAIRLLVERQTQRQTATQFTQFSQAQAVQTGLAEFLRQYPMLREDTQHPLTQAVYAMRNRMVASGWAPGPGTDLEAITKTIATSPHLAVAAQPVPQETTRRAGVTAQQSMEGAAPRRSPQPGQTQPVRPLDKRTAGIAQRMNVKDPQNSMKRFLDRQQTGRSSVSPAIQQAVREEGQA